MSMMMLTRWTATAVRPHMARLFTTAVARDSFEQLLASAPCLSCGKDRNASSTLLAPSTTSTVPVFCSETCAVAPLSSAKQVSLRQLEFTQAARQFGRTPDAKQLLCQLSTGKRRSSPSPPTSWEAFVQAIRGCEALAQDERAVALVSAAYSFPLTLATAISQVQNHSQLPRTINVLVVGARAEAMLPSALWNEVCVLHPTTTVNLVFIGDHVPVRSPKHAHVQVHERLSIQTVAGFYHDLKLDVEPDLLALFNPGIGHPHLRRHWAPTLKQLFQQNGAPVLMTSFSQHDQARDIAVLKELSPSNRASETSLQFLVEPQVNPFRSLQYHVDPADPYNPAQVNQRMLLVRAM